MEQKDARRRAKELGGIATTARPTANGGGWHLGGWAGPKDTWIVVALDGKTVLDDGTTDPAPGPWSPWDDDTETGGPAVFSRESKPDGHTGVKVGQDEDDRTGRSWWIQIVVGPNDGGEYHRKFVTDVDAVGAQAAAMKFAERVTA